MEPIAIERHSTKYDGPPNYTRRADNLTSFKCRLGASTSWNSLDLSRPVMGLLYLLPNYTASRPINFKFHSHLDSDLQRIDFGGTRTRVLPR